MRAIFELIRQAKSLARDSRKNQNVEGTLITIENLIDEIRDNNYYNQRRTYIVCKYWRANCCAFGRDRCHFKHLKFNNNPLRCPFGDRCKKSINGKCNCANNIRA